jgi:hypothetical protein
VSRRFSRSDFNCSALAWTASLFTELRDTPTVCGHLRKNFPVLARGNAPQYRSPACVPQLAQLRFRVAALAIQLRIGISRSRLVRVVPARCPVEVRTIPVIGAVLTPEAFLRRHASISAPSTVKCSPDRRGSASFDTRPKKFSAMACFSSRSRFLVTTIGTHVAFVHAHAHEPAEQQVVIQLLHQHPLAAARVEDLQKQRLQSGMIVGDPENGQLEAQPRFTLRDARYPPAVSQLQLRRTR